METIFDLCRPREDVLKGRVKDEEFAADLAAVVEGTAPTEYADPATFFRHTYPTRGLKTLLETVCRRLSGKGQELSSVIRLDTQYGGGKTHSLIALVHAVRGLKGVDRPEEFVDSKLLPKGEVRVAALDGENTDPANGLRLEKGMLARSIWGEMAYRLAGRKGFERVKASDQKHIAPGAETIVELFGNEPTLIMMDEISAYLRKVVQTFPDAANQFTAFIHALIKAVSASALICPATLEAILIASSPRSQVELTRTAIRAHVRGRIKSIPARSPGLPVRRRRRCCWRLARRPVLRPGTPSHPQDAAGQDAGELGQPLGGCHLGRILRADHGLSSGARQRTMRALLYCLPTGREREV